MKKISLRTHRAPAARENVFRPLHKPPQNDFLEAWTIKINCPYRQKKLTHGKKSPFARAARPQSAKMRSAHYISHLKTTV